MAFSGVTSVRFTAAPGRIKRTETHKEKKDNMWYKVFKTSLYSTSHSILVFDMLNVPLYIPKYPSDLMVLIRQSDLKYKC